MGSWCYGTSDPRTPQIREELGVDQLLLSSFVEQFAVSLKLLKVYGAAQTKEKPVKAIVYRRYGPPDVLELTEIPKPTPRDDEVLIEVHATTVTAGDWRARTLDLPRGFGLISRLVFGISRPRQPILGSEISGKIESVGKAVIKFNAGDQVFAFSGARLGCYVEYKCMPEAGAAALKPTNLSYEKAAAISFGGTTALAFFRRAKIQNGDKVLINGVRESAGPLRPQLTGPAMTFLPPVIDTHGI
jgi:D-arabinose 1-dehydrogenase-like Zn-dependent alcohol dehydrogenase